jgi:glycosyltransferase involved in cell wall biosynthesis
MSIILSHSGKQHSYQVAKALWQLGLLEKFYTSSYITSSFLQKQIQKRNDQYWSRRFMDGLPGFKVNANWRFELPELLMRQWHGKSSLVQKAVYQRDENFDRFVARKLQHQKNSFNLFWGFQGSCLLSLKAAVANGHEAWCELATAHVTAAKRILGEEALLHPEWAHTIDNLVFPSAYERRLEEEPHAATRVIAASSFTSQTLAEIGIPAEKISYLPLGCDIHYVPYDERPDDNLEKRPLKLLYAGTITQRKGIKYLLEAMKLLHGHQDVELHLIGGIQGNDNPLKNYHGLFQYHPPVSQQELFKRYSEFDALILPTVFEGFGLVIVEAMAAGLPVITTAHSIGPEVIKHQKNGYLIPIRDINAIVSSIESMRQLSHQDYQMMRVNARKAALNYSWESYQERLSRLLLSLNYSS